MKQYQHLFFDLDHTLWDFDSNSRLTLEEMYHDLSLSSRGVDDFERFHTRYLEHNRKLWDRYRKGFIKSEELRWKRMWLTLIDFKIGDEQLARQMGLRFLEQLPTRNILFPGTHELLQYLNNKGYKLHLITNGFENTQHSKLRNAAIDHYFVEVITSEGSNSLKPQAAIFEYAFAKTKAGKKESVMIGDDIEADIKGAINAGIDQVYVNHVNAIIDIVPTYTVTSLQELHDIF
jgi:putative hydrolase of the HAD superfamily